MTELLYQTDSYLKNFDAKVLALDNDDHAVLLDQTAFYPGGGGQPFDLGLIRFKDKEIPVKRAKNVGGEIWHALANEADLPPLGAEISGEIDWERRYQTMRTHTAMHILCGVVFRDYGALVTGGDMELLLGRMDFEFESMSADLVQVIEAAINKEVAAAREIKVAILPREKAFQIPDLIRTKINLLPAGIENIRTVEIVGLDLQADGGTHVKNTSEVGTLHISDYKSKGKINKRIYLEILNLVNIEKI
jgi:misacylated tRNA(Ala) deacylase